MGEPFFYVEVPPSILAFLFTGGKFFGVFNNGLKGCGVAALKAALKKLAEAIEAVQVGCVELVDSLFAAAFVSRELIVLAQRSFLVGAGAVTAG